MTNDNYAPMEEIPPVEQHAYKEELIRSWNEAYPVGTDVILTDDYGNKHLTRTRSEAQMLGGHTPVIWTDLKPCYLLTRIQPRKCRVCGCTTFHACKTELGPCHWVADDLCSACN